MQIKKILNRDEIKEIEKIIEKNYGCKLNLKNLFLTGDEKIWIAGENVSTEFFSSVRNCYRIGIYFGKLKRNYKIKLSMEGAIIVGKKAKRNVAIVDDKEARKFAEGNDINKFECIDCEKNNFVIVKRNGDTIGVGILREGYIENLIPKARRMR